VGRGGEEVPAHLSRKRKGNVNKEERLEIRVETASGEEKGFNELDA